MSSLVNQYFGPFPVEYCVYFYTLSVLFGIAFVVSVLSMVLFMVYNYKKVNTTLIVNYIMLLSNIFIAYFTNRLLNTMCVNSI
jgi:hypothetical protein